MKIGFLQFTPDFGKVHQNLVKVAGLLDAVDADLVVLPELFGTGYLFRNKTELMNLAEDLSGETAQTLSKVASDTGCYFVAGFAEKDRGVLFNSAMLVGPDGLVGIYRKSHLFDTEKELFEPGNTGFRVFDIGAARIGMMICFDWFFPESARSLALAGADIIAHPANLVLPYCQTAMPVRGLENRIYSITANRCGSEERGGQSLAFTGRSVIVSPKGETLAVGPGQGDSLQVIDIDVLLARDKKPTKRNHLFEDRRTDLYRL
ncbi:MAG: acyltransferase [Deltaproteobacteria bacterium]|nr:acyltransferase [Deltaproteobacteria bacterium]